MDVETLMDVKWWLDGLRPRDRTIVCMTYGLCGEPEAPRAAIAKRLGVTPHAVTLAEKRIMRDAWASLRRFVDPVEAVDDAIKRTKAERRAERRAEREAWDRGSWFDRERRLREATV